MAYLLCTATKHANPRRNAGFYCHLWSAEVQHDFRLRLCPAHLVAAQNDLAQYELVNTNDAASVIDTPTNCFSCGQPVTELDWHLSITAYPAKNERKDYWARIHVSHSLPEWMQNGEPL